ncbi:hypothetical protein COH97_05495 [Neisseria meningitidis]|nr:hypothetical protein COH97_05495 [Neisseria meningitidis]
MLYKCKIKKLDNTIEEAVLIEINGYELHCLNSDAEKKNLDHHFRGRLQKKKQKKKKKKTHPPPPPPPTPPPPPRRYR